ncbi:tRNA pseudouridine(55) synthase TruB [Paraferrimonas sp. SM1919]|uniref:tRNA pseudouridine(55) synthase TruB n=1 Tax=Paraferrimonas sp. SM1919 TaxID=2662263 RepID=UPI0013D43A24|nr:tRNA pseudouridine(55) synthase TruB [Paraferrimonas sp. SM1919]
MGRRRFKGRMVDGIVLLDKPIGLSSNEALQRVKRIYNAAKAGHTGALDPLATGMLPICLGEATKFSQFLLDADKRYEVTAKLGIRTTTSDADGEVVSEREVNVTAEQLAKAVASFEGDTMQVPSMYSALKYKGEPLYKYARQGIEVPREARPITVFEINILSFNGDEVEMEVHCSKGTYIRTIVDDLGELLGCGAFVSQLRRTGVSGYPYERMVTLEQLDKILEDALADEVTPSERLDPLLLPMDTAIAHFEAVNLDETMASYIMHGQPVQLSGVPAEGLVRLTLGEQQQFIGLGEIDEDGLVAPKRLVNLK